MQIQPYDSLTTYINDGFVIANIKYKCNVQNKQNKNDAADPNLVWLLLLCYKSSLMAGPKCAISRQLNTTIATKVGYYTCYISAVNYRCYVEVILRFPCPLVQQSG